MKEQKFIYRFTTDIQYLDTSINNVSNTIKNASDNR